jgi:PAS domain-containing protein
LKGIDPALRHHLFFRELEKSLKCEKINVSLIQDSNFSLFNVETDEVIQSNEVISNSLTKREPFFHEITEKDVNASPDLLNFLGCASELKNVYFIPMLNSSNSPIGLVTLCNFSSIPSHSFLTELKILSTLSGLLFSNQEPKIWQAINESKSLNFKFNQWSKVLYQVGKFCISNLIHIKTLTLSSFKSSSFEEVLKNMMQAFACMTNCTESVLKITNESHSLKVSTSSFTSPLPVKTLIRFKSDLIAQKTIKIREETDFELRIPIKLKNVTGLLKVRNSHKALGSDYVNDTIPVVSDIKIICAEIAEKFLRYPGVFNDDISDLVDSMKIFALKYKPTSFYISVQKATCCLVDCEHAIFCLKKGEKIVIPQQKCDLDIPDDYVLEKKEGMIFSVLESGNPLIVDDVYLDERFNTKLDKLTGYRTSNVLITPLIYNSRRIGTIKAINKKEGEFSQNDLQVMHNLSESICLTLDLIENIQASFEERSRLAAIMNSMDKHVIVLNDLGSLVYSSKPTESLFRLPFDSIQKTNYSEWVPYPELKSDLASVLENPKTTLQKYSQQLKNFSEDERLKPVNYSISQIAFFSSECYFGVILVIEDSLLIDRLYNELRHVRNSVVSLTSPISGETKLQKTIQELRMVKFHVKDPELNSRLDQIIYGLQEGNLTTPKLIVDKNDASIDALTSILEMPNELLQVKSASTFGDLDDLLDVGTAVSLDELRNWDLNPFQLENHFEYIMTMMKDFDLVSNYKIDPVVLMTFLSKVKEKYSYWKNSFHNFMHGFNVMHGCYMLLSSTPAGNYFSSHQILALLIASLCHDLDHRGRTNVFEVNKRSVIANTYHDESVLEKHHAAVAFFIINEENSNIFAKLNNETYMAVRKLMISSILATDMAKHLGIIEEAKNRFLEIESKRMGSLENDVEKLSGLIMHCADLFHPCKSYQVYEIWSILVCKEFTDQYNEEVELNIPVTSYFKDLDKPLVYYSNEIGFLGYIVKPLWMCLKNFLAPCIDKVIENLENNIEIMKRKKEVWGKVEANEKE